MMRKISMLLMVAFLMVVTTVAQERERPERRMEPEEMVKMRTDRMVKEYGLDESQAKRLEVLNAEFMEKERPQAPEDRGSRPTKEEMEKMQEERKANREVYNQQLKEILTPEQFNSYTEKEAKMMEGEGRRGHRR